MAEQKLIIRDFTGAIGTISEKEGKVGTGRYLRGLNVYRDASFAKTSRATTKVSSTTVTDLPQWMEDGSPFDTFRYMVDASGDIYQISSSDVFSKVRTPSSNVTTAGEGLKVFDDILYYAGTYTVGTYGYLSGTASWTDDVFTTSAPLATASADAIDKMPDMSEFAGGTGATAYSVPTSISETATNRKTFEPSKDPLKQVQFKILATGAGDWTFTLHDEFDREVGAVTVANGSLVVGENLITFANPAPRVRRFNSYHIHVTSTAGSGTVDTDVNNDLEGASFVAFFGVLIGANFHPIQTYQNLVIFGNERYLATWDGAIYDPNAILFDAGQQVRTMAKFEEFIAIGTHSGTDVNASENQRVWFWDVENPDANTYSDATIGAPQAIHNTRNTLIGVYGNKGSIYLGQDPFNKSIGSLPNMPDTGIVEILPGAITEYKGRTLVGYVAGQTNIGSFEKGVYEFGSQVDETANSFNFPFVISTGGLTTADLQIGMVKSVGDDLYIGWGESAAYGVDKIDNDSTAYDSPIWESLIFDDENTDAPKLPKSLIFTFETLTTNQTFTPKFRRNRAASWTDGDDAVVGDTRAEMPIYNRFEEIEFGFEIDDPDGDFVKITSIMLVYDDLKEERRSR